MLRHWSADYVGIPYRDKGRDSAGCDCWGLPVLVYRDRASIELPTYDEAYPSAADKAEIAAIVAYAAGSPVWEKIEAARELDIAVFRDGVYTSHVGIMIDQVTMLHTARDDCAKLERIDTTRWRSRLTGIFRHRDLI